MNTDAMFKIGYGLFVITTKENNFDNGCIINTVTQVTSQPNRIAVTVSRQNKTHDMIFSTGKFNISVLTESVPFDLIKHFGFQSGKEVNKFENSEKYTRTANGLLTLKEHTNAYICANVFHSVDLGTHTLFIADVTDADVLSDETSVTYDYYHKNIKPKAEAKPESKLAYRCKICGYVHEGELPEDFICPLCKHPASDFERI